MKFALQRCVKLLMHIYGLTGSTAAFSVCAPWAFNLSDKLLVQYKNLFVCVFQSRTLEHTSLYLASQKEKYKYFFFSSNYASFLLLLGFK